MHLNKYLLFQCLWASGSSSCLWKCFCMGVSMTLWLQAGSGAVTLEESHITTEPQLAFSIRKALSLIYPRIVSASFIRGSVEKQTVKNKGWIPWESQGVTGWNCWVCCPRFKFWLCMWPASPKLLFNSSKAIALNITLNMSVFK